MAENMLDSRVMEVNHGPDRPGSVRSVRVLGTVAASQEAVPKPDDGLTEDPVRQYLAEVGRYELLTAADEVELCQRIEAGLMATHMLGVGSEADISVEADQGELTELAAIGAAAMESMINANLRLVVSMAKGYQGNGLDLLDLIQEGNLGLMQAVRKFDYRMGNKFSTYATIKIRQAISRGIANQGRTIRVPVHMSDRLEGLKRVKADMALGLGREPNAEELAHGLGIEVPRLKELRDYELRTRLSSLDMPVGGDNDTKTLGDILGGTLVGGEDTDPHRAAEAARACDALGELLHELGERDEAILRAYYGLGDVSDKPMSLEEIGAQLGMTRQGVGEVVRRATARLKVYVREDPYSLLRERG